MLTPRRLSLLAGLAVALPASADPLPDDLAALVSVDHPDAVVRLAPGTRLEDGDAPVIEVIAPATAAVRFGDAPGDTSQSRVPFLPAEFLDITFAGEGDLAADIEFLPDGSEILVLNRETSNITRFDAATQSPLSSIQLSEPGLGFDVTSDGRAIVANYTVDTASIVDLATGVETSVAVGDAPGWVEVSPDGAFAAVGCADSTIHVIDLATGTVARVIPTLGNAQITSFNTESARVDFRVTTPVKFIDDATLAFVARFDDAVSFIDVTTGTRTDIPTTATDPFGIDLAGGVIAVGHAVDPGAVTIIDPVTLTVDRTITASTRGNGPLALNADGTRAVVTLQNTTRVLDLTTDTFGPTLNTSNLQDVVSNFDRTRAFGIGFSGAVIDFATGSLLARANDRASLALGAASPTADFAAGAATTFGDDLVVIATDASPTLEYFGRTGPEPDGDVSLHTAVSDDGTIAVSSNTLSDNLSIFSTATGSLTGLAPLSDRPGEVELSPDGSTAVVCNLDGFEVSVIDVGTGTTTVVPSARRLAQVEIDPAGGFAYLAQVASGDGIRKLDLTTNTFVGGLLPTGNLGGVGYSFSQESQIALNPDGNFLAIASSFTDEVFIVDTTSMTVLQTLPTGAFPSRVAFSDDGFYLLAAEKNADRVRVFFNQLDPMLGVAYASAGTINVGDQPFDMVVLPDNSKAFVLNWGDEAVGVLDPVTLQQTAVIPVPFRPMGLSLSGDGAELRVAGGNRTTTVGGGVIDVLSEGEVTVINTDTLAIIERINTGQPASDLKSSADATTFAYASPNADGLILINEDCPADANNDGVVNPGDFNAWVIQFNTQGPKCDQNGDGLCNPADFNAWVINFNNGC
ncbi:MAG: beta-propeller fold lactonase family protein [Planctomycetota bacterium]